MFFLFKLTACIDVLTENNTLVKFKQDMFEYKLLHMINDCMIESNRIKSNSQKLTRTKETRIKSNS